MCTSSLSHGDTARLRVRSALARRVVSLATSRCLQQECSLQAAAQTKRDKTSSTADQIRNASLCSNSVLEHDARSDNDSKGSKGKQPLPQQTVPVTPQRLKEREQRKRRGRKRWGKCRQEFPNSRSVVQVNLFVNGDSSYTTARRLSPFFFGPFTVGSAMVETATATILERVLRHSIKFFNKSKHRNTKC